MENSKNHRKGTSQESKPNEPWWKPSFILFMKLIGWIGVPVIAALCVGRWLDDKYGTEPWLFLFLVVISFVIASVGVMKESSDAMKSISEECEVERRRPSDKEDSFK